LGIAGNGYLDRKRERRHATQRRDQAIAELLTATVDLVSGIYALCAAYVKQGIWRQYIRVSVVILSAAGTALGPERRFSADVLRDWHRMVPGFDRIGYGRAA
jgi:hypothetical protein